MTLELQIDALPLTVDETGTIRVSGTRITLDIVIGYYKQGMSAEEIAEAYPSVPLADIYAVIAYYLRHREQLDAYLAEGHRKFEEIRKQVQSEQGPQITRAELEARRARKTGSLLQVLADENFNAHIIDDVRRDYPDVDFVTVSSVGLLGAPDSRLSRVT